MSSVQTGQLISLLMNNVLMVFISGTVVAIAWLRWHWLRTWMPSTRLGRRRYHWAYLSFTLAIVTLLGMLTSLGMLVLRTMLTFNILVLGAMGVFLLSVISLLLALGLWFIDLWADWGTLPRRLRRPLPPSSVTWLPPASASTSTNSRRKRPYRRQCRQKAL